MAEFDYVCEYRPRVKNNVADGVSGLRTTAGDTGPVEEEVPCFVITPSGQDLSDEEETVAHLKGVWDDGFHDKIMMPEGLAIGQEQTNTILITVEELAREQALYPWCRTLSAQVGQAKSQFDVDRHGVLVRESQLDGALHKVIPHSLRFRVL